MDVSHDVLPRQGRCALRAIEREPLSGLVARSADLWLLQRRARLLPLYPGSQSGFTHFQVLTSSTTSIPPSAGWRGCVAERPHGLLLVTRSGLDELLADAPARPGTPLGEPGMRSSSATDSPADPRRVRPRCGRRERLPPKAIRSGPGRTAAAALVQRHEPPVSGDNTQAITWRRTDASLHHSVRFREPIWHGLWPGPVHLQLVARQLASRIVVLAERRP